MNQTGSAAQEEGQLDRLPHTPGAPRGALIRSEGGGCPQVIHWDASLPSLGRAVACIGVFDGVHRGHQALIAAARAVAVTRACLCVVVTFEPDPASVVPGCTSQARLLSLDQRVSRIRKCSPDVVLVLPFTPDMAATHAPEFLDRVLMKAMEPAGVVVGVNFRFGAGGEGDIATLAAYGASHGFDVSALPLVDVRGAPVSATRIRRLIQEGRIREAAELLGRPHELPAELQLGGDGRLSVEFPTGHALPAAGWYECLARVGDVRRRVTVAVDESSLRHHLSLRNGLTGRELEGCTISLEFNEPLPSRSSWRCPTERGSASSGTGRRSLLTACRLSTPRLSRSSS